MKNQLHWARRARQRAEAVVKQLRQAKSGSELYGTTSHFLARVALSSPVQSSRAFAQTWQDLVGAGGASLGRTTIESIRNAFCVVVKELYEAEVRSAATRAAGGAAQPAKGLGAPGHPPHAVVLHVHDEASLRLRSAQDASAAPSRGRSSKVLQHVIWVNVGEAGRLYFSD